MRGQRHLVQCRCVLQQYKNLLSPPRHQFMVFSIVDDDDNCRVKYAQCNNCGLIHRVTDLCKSEIISGKEQSNSILTIEDIKDSIPQNLVAILERNNVDLSTWELAQFILENKRWGEFLILGSEEDSGTRQGKYVRIVSDSFFKVETFSRDEILMPGDN